MVTDSASYARLAMSFSIANVELEKNALVFLDSNRG